jgi:hypothetical protein
VQIRSLALLVPALLVLTVLVVPTATAAPRASVPSSVTVKDPADDVHVFRRATGLSRAHRLSIDIRRVQVTPRAASVRFAVRLRAVPRRMPVDQMVFVALAPAPGSSATGPADIGFSPQKPGLSYAALDTGTGGAWESCDPLRVKVRRAARDVRLDVPSRCIPAGEVDVKVMTLTGYFRSDSARPWSRDRLRFPAPVVLR